MSGDSASPTLRDVAERAGVSTATASFALNGRRRGRSRPVTDETLERVLRAAEELGYQRNHAARSLRRRRTDSVCVVYRPPSNPWVERLAEQLHHVALGYGYSVITMPVGPDDRVASAVRILREQFVDGIVLTPNHCFPVDELAGLARNARGMIVFDDAAEPAGFDVVRQREGRACYAAVQHLIEDGHRRIAYFGHGDADGPPTQDVKYRNYQQALADHAIPLDESLVTVAADSRHDAYLATSALLERPDHPTALFSGSDRAGIAAIMAAQQRGWSVPGDLAVVGVGSTDEGAVIEPALTTVGIPAFDFSAIVDRLFSRLESADALPDTVLDEPWELIVRRSSRAG